MQKGCQQSRQRKDGKKTKDTRGQDGGSVTGRKPQKQGKRRAGPHDRYGEQNQRSAVRNDRERARQQEDGAEIRKENRAERKRQGDEIRVVAAVEKEPS